MLRARITALLRPLRRPSSDFEEREAYQSDIRELRPDAWSGVHPRALGSDVEQALLLAGVGSRDFAQVVGLELAPHLVTPVDDIVSISEAHAESCAEQACALRASLPRPNPWGRPPLPWHESDAREAERLERASAAWAGFASALINNRWDAD